MFEQCNTLAELNAARIKALGTCTVIELNNAYNVRRAEILQSRSNYTRVNPVYVTIPERAKYCGIPFAGYSQEAGVIKLTQAGFLF